MKGINILNDWLINHDAFAREVSYDFVGNLSYLNSDNERLNRQAVMRLSNAREEEDTLDTEADLLEQLKTE